jgi:superfamily II RNA helicase
MSGSKARRRKGRRPADGKPEGRRPAGGQPEGGKPAGGKPEGGKSEGGKPAGGKPGRREGDRAGRPGRAGRSGGVSGRPAPEGGGEPERRPRISVDEDARALLQMIGIPVEAPFKPDPFQVKAAALVKEHDVIVSAPTGSGKTWIARQALERESSLGRRSWYASPLKALSNSKYIEFGKLFGADRVGLLTGDHKINTDAPILVGTTEILRNQLYDAMTGFSPLEVDLVVLDEAHYLGDDERGVVWEEILIYMPQRVRFLLLSATIDNARELAAWLGRNRGRPVRVVQGGLRPVPLEPLCLHEGRLQTLARAVRGGAGQKPSRRFYFGRQDPGPWRRLPDLAQLDLLPAIFFLKSRKECDEAARMAPRTGFDTPEKAAERRRVVGLHAGRHPHLEGYASLGPLLERGLASHHAGHLPQYKMLVEELMSANLLSAIFATSTVAAGVNFPARTVIIPQSDRFNGERFAPLTATELAQMTGRAGRRGLDDIGFAVLLKGPHQDLALMRGLFGSPPDPVRSALRINFSMTLNLLKAYEIDQIHDLLARSLLAWQSVPRRTRGALRRASEDQFRSFVRHVDFLAEAGLVTASGRLTGEGELAAALRVQHPLVLHAAIAAGGFPAEPELMAGAMAALTEERPEPEPRDWARYRRLQQGHPHLRRAVSRLAAAARPMVRLLSERGFPAPGEADFRSCLAMHQWASTHDYLGAVGNLGERGGYPGDLVRLVLLVGEHLNQLANLESPDHADLIRTAAQARRLILVEPMI